MRAWPDGGIGRFYFCSEHGVLARRQTRIVGTDWRSCKYCLNRRDRLYYRAHPELRKLRQARTFRSDPERASESYARFNAEQAAWVEDMFGADIDVLEDRPCYGGTAQRTGRTFEILNERLPTWPQWARLLGAVMAPITAADLYRWSHDAELKREERDARERARKVREEADRWERWSAQQLEGSRG